MNLVDSCGWLEYFAAGSNAEFFAPAIEDRENLLVPTICMLEVFKRFLQQRTEQEASDAIAEMRKGYVVGLDDFTAICAAKLSHELKLPVADGVILATARVYEAEIWTQDADFKGIEGVRFKTKR